MFTKIYTNDNNDMNYNKNCQSADNCSYRNHNNQKEEMILKTKFMVEKQFQGNYTEKDK